MPAMRGIGRLTSQLEPAPPTCMNAIDPMPCDLTTP